jgi:hypothetical protein
MRTILVVGLLIFLCPVGAMAQGTLPPAAPAATPPEGPGARGGCDFTRDEFVERVKRRAEKRFNQMDANRDGILTAEERRAFRAKRQQNKAKRE